MLATSNRSKDAMPFAKPFKLRRRLILAMKEAILGEKITEAISYLEEEKSISLSPSCIYNFQPDERLLEVSPELSKRTYVLFPQRYANLNLHDGSSDSEDAKDNFLLAALMLLRALVYRKTPGMMVVFDNASQLNRFERMSALVNVVVNGSRLPICCFNDGRVFKTFRQGKAQSRKRYMTHSNVQKPYPENSIPIPLLLRQDLTTASLEGHTALYVKTRPQRFRSGFPRFSLIEDRITDAIGSERLIVIVPGMEGLPKRMDDGGYVVLTTEDFTATKIHFVNNGSHPLSAKLVDVEKWTRELFSEKSDHLNITDALMAILIASYDGNDEPTAFEERLVLGASETVTLRYKLKSICEYVRLCSTIRRPALLLKDWEDIARTARESEGGEIKIDFFKELEKPLRSIFGNIFIDVFYVYAFINRSHRASSFAELTTVASALKGEMADYLGLDYGYGFGDGNYPNEDYDPEESIAHLASDYDYGIEEKIIDAFHFILKEGGKRYIFYCRMGGDSQVKLAHSKTQKKLSELAVGDVIKKDYWDYYSLKSGIIGFIEMEDPKDKAEINNSMKYSDDFRELLRKYALEVSPNELANEYESMCAASNVRNFLMDWSFITMRPFKKEMLKKVVSNVNGKFGTGIDFNALDASFSKLKDMRKKIGRTDDGKPIKTNFTYYEVVSGPSKTRVEVEKLGKIFRIS